MGGARLPRLLYVGDVAVESSYHGSALLFRLLEEYTADLLQIIEGSLQTSRPERRLPGVHYAVARVGSQRLLNTRLHSWYSLLLTARGGAHTRAVEAAVGAFSPEAVLTVVHGYLWVTAAEMATRCNLPLHLIVHDDWPRIARLPRPFTRRIGRQFADVYRQAASRLCVSPFMVEEYRRRYGVEGTLLYPSRAKSVMVFDTPPDRLSRPASRLTFGFAGTINTPDYCRLLQMLAECLEATGGRILIFGPLTRQQALDGGLTNANIELRGLLPSDELMERLRTEVDVLFVPMSFAERDKANMEISFPSKLTDYTAVGLPILIAGPPYCSAVRWARANPGVAEVVDADDQARLRTAVAQLSSPKHRLGLARRALSVGERMFSSESARQQFLSALGRPYNQEHRLRLASCALSF